VPDSDVLSQAYAVHTQTTSRVQVLRRRAAPEGRKRAEGARDHVGEQIVNALRRRRSAQSLLEARVVTHGGEVVVPACLVSERRVQLDGFV
jgi:hypothetical protein